MTTSGPPASAFARPWKLAQLCYLPKTKQSYAISTVHSANRPKLSTSVLIAKTLAQLEPKKMHTLCAGTDQKLAQQGQKK